MSRRRLLLAAAVSLALPGLARAARPLAQMTDGPFYPPRAWRQGNGSDWDADLTRVQRGSRVLVARGEHLALALSVVDTDDKPIDNAEVEIWQCDAEGAYRHPNVDDAFADPGFQGFGSARSGADGTLALRTIRPVPYPGRTPHIHVKLRHPAFGEATSQLFVAGEPGNTRDFLWRQLKADERAALEMKLQPAAGEGLRWQTNQRLVVKV
jgi:protocatechuate 3,4-dioxygenase, beta subunit